jgi:hypothetical protein
MAESNLKPGKPLTEEEIKKRILVAQNMPTFYASHVRIVPSFFDIRMSFGQMNVTPTGEQSIQEQMALLVSPECAQTIVDALTIALTQYQATFGAIRKPTAPIQLTRTEIKDKKPKTQR